MRNKKALVKAVQAGGIMGLLLLAMGSHIGALGGKPPLLTWLQEVWKWMTGKQG